MDGEVEMIQCFFNPSHMIFRSRYPYHYQRCSRQHPHVKHKVCPYNALHIILPEAYEAHLTKCDSRTLSTLTAYNAAVHRPKPEVSSPAPIESWDEPANDWGTEKPVVPQTAQSNIFIYAPKIGATEAERVQYRREARRLYQQIEESQKANEAQSNKDKKKKKKKKKTHNSNSNSENINDASGNQRAPTNSSGKVPLAERNETTTARLNMARLSLRD